MKKLLALLVLISTLTAHASDPLTSVQIETTSYDVNHTRVTAAMVISTNKVFASQQDRFRISSSSTGTVDVWAYRDARQTANGFEPAKSFSCFVPKESYLLNLAISLATTASEETFLEVIGRPGGECLYIDHTKDSRNRVNAQGDIADDIRSVSLVSSLTNEVIQELTNGMTISLSDVGTNLNIVAETKDGFSSIRFNSSSEGYSRNEAVAPFAYRGDTSGNFFNWNPGAGTFTLTVTPYKGSPNASEAGDPREITVFFEN